LFRVRSVRFLMVCHSGHYVVDAEVLIPKDSFA